MIDFEVNPVLRDIGGKIFPFRDIFTSSVFVWGEIRVDKFLVMLHQFVEGFLDKYNILVGKNRYQVNLVLKLSS